MTQPQPTAGRPYGPTCTCAAEPPTMPVYRVTHLPTCPLSSADSPAVQALVRIVALEAKRIGGHEPVYDILAVACPVCDSRDRKDCWTWTPESLDAAKRRGENPGSSCPAPWHNFDPDDPNTVLGVARNALLNPDHPERKGGDDE